MIVENLPVPFDRRVWQEARTLVKNGFGVSIVCPKNKSFNNPYEVLDGICIYRYQLPIHPRSYFGYALEYAVALFLWLRLSIRIFSKEPFQVIHAANPPDLIFLIAGLFKIWHGTKFIYDHHDLCPELYLAKSHRKDPWYRLMLLLERVSIGMADVVISTNDSFRDIAISRGKKDPSKVVVVRSGVDIARFHHVNPLLQHKRGKRILVGYLGIIAKQDGVDLLVQVVSHIVKEMKRSDIAFTIVGDGPELENIISLTRRLGLSEYILFAGPLYGDELLEILSSCDICVACDPYNEMNDKSTMNKTMEYMALGKPMVHFDLKEGRHTAQSASLYATPNDIVDMANKIVHLADSPTLRMEMGKIGHERTESELQWARVEPKLIEAYNLANI